MQSSKFELRTITDEIILTNNFQEHAQHKTLENQF